METEYYKVPALETDMVARGVPSSHRNHTHVFNAAGTSSSELAFRIVLRYLRPQAGVSQQFGRTPRSLDCVDHYQCQDTSQLRLLVRWKLPADYNDLFFVI